MIARRQSEAATPLDEQAIQAAVIEHFAWRATPNAFCFHCPNGGYRRPAEAAILKGIGTVAGIPDLICIQRGRVFCLELKREGGRVSDVQRITHERSRRAGAEVGVAFGLDQALSWLEERELLRERAA